MRTFGRKGRTILHQNIHRFQYKICEYGHLIYSEESAVSDEFCRICGSKFLTQCPECGKALPTVFSSPVYFSSGKPVHFPNKPGACVSCGKVFPWTLREAAKIEMTDMAALALVCQICNRFHRVVRQLRHRREDRPSFDVGDEYDVQDLLHCLLQLHFDDIRTEEWTPTYAVGAARMDFLLKDFGIVIETKKTRRGLKPKDVGSQLIEDIAKYKQSPDCKKLLCFVYDPEERVMNRDGLIRDLESLDSDIEVKVIVSPTN